MRKMALATGLFVLMISVVFGAAHADPLPLVNNGGGLIYDPNLGITWYDYTYTGPAGNGATWPQAMSWASSLRMGGVGGWTLPSISPLNGSTLDGGSWSADGSTDACFNLSAPGSAYPGNKASQMAYLFYYELGNTAPYYPNGTPGNLMWGLKNTGPFENLQGHIYLSSSTDADGATWWFDFAMGDESRSANLPGYNNFYAIAVHAGDVGAPVPIPVAILLFAPGLAGLAALKKKYIG